MLSDSCRSLFRVSSGEKGKVACNWRTARCPRTSKSNKAGMKPFPKSLLFGSKYFIEPEAIRYQLRISLDELADYPDSCVLLTQHQISSITPNSFQFPAWHSAPAKQKLGVAGERKRLVQECRKTYGETLRAIGLRDTYCQPDRNRSCFYIVHLERYFK